MSTTALPSPWSTSKTATAGSREVAIIARNTSLNSGSSSVSKAAKPGPIPFPTTSIDCEMAQRSRCSRLACGRAPLLRDRGAEGRRESESTERANRHADVGFFLQTYAHVIKNDDREAAEQAASFLLGEGWGCESDDEEG